MKSELLQKIAPSAKRNQYDGAAKAFSSRMSIVSPVIQAALEVSRLNNSRMCTAKDSDLIATLFDEKDRIEAKLKESNGKITDIKWYNDKDKDKAIEETFYNDKVIIEITTEDLVNKEISISILDKDTSTKVAEWDKATDNDITLKAVVDENNTAKMEFIPKDEWFSKGAKDKFIITSISYGEKTEKMSKSVFKVKCIDYIKNMTASDNALHFTAAFESLAMICPDKKVRAYKDSKGIWTIGIGEAATSGTITADTVIDSETEAWNRFVKKMKTSYTNTARNNLENQGVKRTLKQCEFDALIDFVYNCGNCTYIAKLIAEDKNMQESDFLIKGHADRRKLTYKLYSGETLEVNGYKKYYRKDNTNHGYDDIEEIQETRKIQKDGKTVEELVFETIDGKQVPKMKKNKERGYWVVNSNDKYSLQY